MPDANYVVTGTAVISTASVALFFNPITSAPTTSASRVVTSNSSFAVVDTAYVQVAIFR
jgi:hypothetical protein